MIAPLIGDLVIEVPGETISKPYVDMTLDIMEQFGVSVTRQDYQKYTVAGSQNYQTSEYRVEGDVSSASYFFAIAALTESTITVTNLNPRSKQADMAFLKILASMGNQVRYGENEITVAGTGLRPLSVDMQDCPDQAMTLAVLAAFADGVTTISGVQSLRVKETERVVAVQQELRKMGVQTTATNDTLVIHGGKPKAASISTYGDHRLAMSFAVAGTKIAGMEIEDPDVVAKTFPEFWDKLAALGVGIREVPA
jgi:3-phosphoshikimate 1-carboxyvinyltransferase